MPPPACLLVAAALITNGYATSLISETTSSKQNGLSQAVIIGIAVGASLVALLAIVWIIIACRGYGKFTEWRKARRRRRYGLDLDGGYSSPTQSDKDWGLY